MDPVNQFISSLQSAVGTSLQDNLVAVITLIPNLIAAVIITVIGWLVGIAAAKVIEKILGAIKFEDFLSKHKVSDALGKLKVSRVLIKLTEYYIILIFLQAAVSLIGLGTITDFMRSLLLYAPVLVGAALIFVLAAVLGELVKEKITAFEPKSRLAVYTGRALKLIVIIMGLVVGLSTMGFDVSIITLTFVTLIQGLIYGVALALGIAFGLGGQDTAKELVKKAKERVNL